MIDTLSGNLGHFLMIVAFVFAIASAVYYGLVELGVLDKGIGKKYGRLAFYVHGLSVIGVVAILFSIIYQHKYEYYYAWSHSSNNLPVHFMISCFWEGQEGSFLLWIFWHVILGFFVIRTAKKWENSAMLIFSLVQAFLVSMILGIDLWGMKLGSSPFILLRDAVAAPIFEMNPNYIPTDGNGLNPLLQNYWMVIHPPTLFLGFAATLVPFAFLMAGLVKRDYTGWIKPALGWTVFGVFILGLGIMMGAYWAYETLNFGGYWNWDPVENAVYIPWLVMVGALHLMLVYRKNGTALVSAMILTMASFLLVLYATFLTRSGVLGEASVHSFTDLGLSGQLVVYLLFFVVIAIGLLAYRWKELPKKDNEVTAYSREFWIFMGATILCIASFQVFLPTSIPAFNSFLGFFGVNSNWAPPADAVTFYTTYQKWFAVIIAILSGTGQYFYWQKLDSRAKVWDKMMIPVIVTMVATTAVLLAGKVDDLSYIILLTASMYSVISNAFVLIKLFSTKNANLSGGAISHIGIALMLIGIMFSSGYSNTISLNMSGRQYSSQFSEEMNKENLLLFRNESKQMRDYMLTYKGPRMESEDIPGYIERESLMFFEDPYKAILKEDIVQKGETYGHKGDTIQIYNENIYYEVEYRRKSSKDGKEEVFSLYPRVQHNEQMGVVPSPGIVNYPDRDIYTHITQMAVDDEEVEWSEPMQKEVAVGDTIIVHDFFMVFDGVVRESVMPGVELGEGDVALRANLRVLGNRQDHDIRPFFVIKGGQVGLVPDTKRDLGLKVQLDEINPKDEKFKFTMQTTQRDWIILKAVEKPLINLLWIGTIVLCIGTCISMSRRFKDYANDKKEVEDKAEEKEEILA
ncbi:cytochrome c biogenesis protein CcsA [Sediminitomix flava]|uniref:Cytochrome c-type biogenesis protein CcmF n=1 Tax=Sediminitomix flava TaxID=379075 RepID=A0A315ZCX3_SEDFL|nr:cytochrome c biogenesis protein CcsA [Sediminitomix flava]PWJ42959.1 cytochrome c-type biogenesis protein CcmF [Sediminitomix flava]